MDNYMNNTHTDTVDIDLSGQLSLFELIYFLFYLHLEH